MYRYSFNKYVFGFYFYEAKRIWKNLEGAAEAQARREELTAARLDAEKSQQSEFYDSCATLASKIPTLKNPYIEFVNIGENSGRYNFDVTNCTVENPKYLVKEVGSAMNNNPGDLANAPAEFQSYKNQESTSLSQSPNAPQILFENLTDAKYQEFKNIFDRLNLSHVTDFTDPHFVNEATALMSSEGGNITQVPNEEGRTDYIAFTNNKGKFVLLMNDGVYIANPGDPEFHLVFSKDQNFAASSDPVDRYISPPVERTIPENSDSNIFKNADNLIKLMAEKTIPENNGTGVVDPNEPRKQNKATTKTETAKPKPATKLEEKPAAKPEAKSAVAKEKPAAKPATKLEAKPATKPAKEKPAVVPGGSV